MKLYDPPGLGRAYIQSSAHTNFSAHTNIERIADCLMVRRLRGVSIKGADRWEWRLRNDLKVPSEYEPLLSSTRRGA